MKRHRRRPSQTCRRSVLVDPFRPILARLLCSLFTGGKSRRDGGTKPTSGEHVPTTEHFADQGRESTRPRTEQSCEKSDMIIILMGVSGSGKTTIGTRLAETLGWSFFDADDFHPAANIKKMQRGIPLTEQDRRPWLLTLRERIAQWLDEDLEVVLACSALKESYREALLVDPSRVRLVYLKGSYALIQKRVIQRPRHFMPEELLASQFDALEEPNGIFAVDIALRPQEIVDRIRKELHV